MVTVPHFPIRPLNHRLLGCHGAKKYAEGGDFEADAGDRKPTTPFPSAALLL